MIHPSYRELIEHINVVNKEIGQPEVLSRYSLVLAAAKRARSLIDKDAPMVNVNDSMKELSIAVEEMRQEKIGLYFREQTAEEAEAVEYDHMAVVDLSADIDEEEE